MTEVQTEFAQPTLPRPGMSWPEFVSHELHVPVHLVPQYLAMMRMMAELLPGGNLADVASWWYTRRQLHLAQQMSQETIGSAAYLALGGQAEEARVPLRIIQHESDTLDGLRQVYNRMTRQEETRG